MTRDRARKEGVNVRIPMYSPEHRAEYVALLCAILSEGGDTVSQAAHAADDAMAEVRARFDLPPREFCDLVSSIDIHLAHDADAAPYRRAAADLYPRASVTVYRGKLRKLTDVRVIITADRKGHEYFDRRVDPRPWERVERAIIKAAEASR